MSSSIQQKDYQYCNDTEEPEVDLSTMMMRKSQWNNWHRVQALK
jgi:hypothetical protein